MSTTSMRETIEQLYALQSARNEAANRYSSTLEARQFGYARVSDNELQAAERAYLRAEREFSNERNRLVALISDRSANCDQ